MSKDRGRKNDISLPLPWMATYVSKQDFHSWTYFQSAANSCMSIEPSPLLSNIPISSLHVSELKWLQLLLRRASRSSDAVILPDLSWSTIYNKQEEINKRRGKEDGEGRGGRGEERGRKDG